ncbi:Aldehyde/histidinol dehydrogenase [Rhodocollybia butyracea]|uniref:Aldehyde/histidinol dehydrogenase n=1 Tax=Rhodocollybia butyracea TaxID=206335 RepID=A0A9P5PH74_9AGAR|nr:Aldehyde/histidinol dehydrogenase [Rhodocollybia butyracea]
MVRFLSLLKVSCSIELYVASSIWDRGFEDQPLPEISGTIVGSLLNRANFIDPIHMLTVTSQSARAKDSKQSKEKDRQSRYSENVNLTDGYNDDHLELSTEGLIGKLVKQPIPHDHAKDLCARTRSRSRQRRSQLKQNENIPWNIRAAIFLEAADLNARLAEVLLLSRIEFRPLEGFVFAVMPFNFTAIGRNLCATLALMGNKIVWKPSPTATYSDYIVHQIFAEAGSPVHLQAGEGHYGKYGQVRGVPEDYQSTEVRNAVIQAVRGAFAYQSQKCSALSRFAALRLLVNLDWRLQGSASNVICSSSIIHVHADANGHLFRGRTALDKITSYIHMWELKSSFIGGTGYASNSYFIQPTVILTKDPHVVTMVKEIFGPVITVSVSKL